MPMPRAAASPKKGETGLKRPALGQVALFVAPGDRLGYLGMAYVRASCEGLVRRP
jgi:hypothetical protein